MDSKEFEGMSRQEALKYEAWYNNGILQIKRNPEYYTYQEFAIQNFDAAIKFDEFLKNL